MLFQRKQNVTENTCYFSFHILLENLFRSFLFSGNLWKMSNIPDFDFITEYVLPSFLAIPYQCLEKLTLYMN